jgi:2-phosphoglycerate kinase
MPTSSGNVHAGEDRGGYGKAASSSSSAERSDGKPELEGNKETGASPNTESAPALNVSRGSPTAAADPQEFNKYHVRTALNFIGIKPTNISEMMDFILLPSNRAAKGGLGDVDGSSDVEIQPAVEEALRRWNYLNKLTVRDFSTAWNLITRKKEPLIVLLMGTSGTGKSTLASLLSSRLGFTAVLSTDSIRQLMRNFTSEDDSPFLFASSYNSDEKLSDKQRQHIVKTVRNKATNAGKAYSEVKLEKKVHKRCVQEGFKLQCALVERQLQGLLQQFSDRRESVVVEGVHLTVEVVVELMKRHTFAVPFLVHISNEKKHCERFAIRSRNMTLNPKRNKYVKNFQNIRIIQRHLHKRAESFMIPKIDNTNVDRSLATVHSTLLRVMRRADDTGERILSITSGKADLLSAEYEFAHERAWSSKEMKSILKKKKSKRLVIRQQCPRVDQDGNGTTHSCSSAQFLEAEYSSLASLVVNSKEEDPDLKEESSDYKEVSYRETDRTKYAWSGTDAEASLLESALSANSAHNSQSSDDGSKCRRASKKGGKTPAFLRRGGSMKRSRLKVVKEFSSQAASPKSYAAAVRGHEHEDEVSPEEDPPISMQTNTSSTSTHEVKAKLEDNIFNEHVRVPNVECHCSTSPQVLQSVDDQDPSDDQQDDTAQYTTTSCVDSSNDEKSSRKETRHRKLRFAVLKSTSDSPPGAALHHEYAPFEESSSPLRPAVAKHVHVNQVDKRAVVEAILLAIAFPENSAEVAQHEEDAHELDVVARSKGEQVARVAMQSAKETLQFQTCGGKSSQEREIVGISGVVSDAQSDGIK